jgi:hypothetical protein
MSFNLEFKKHRIAHRMAVLLLLVYRAFSKSVCEGGKCNEANTKDGQAAYKRGDLIKVWAKIEGLDGETDNETWTAKWIQWYVTVDKLTILTIPDINCTFLSYEHSRITIFTKFGNSEAHLYRADNDHVVEFLSVLLYFAKGVGTGVKYDSNFDVNACLNPFKQAFTDTCAIDRKTACTTSGETVTCKADCGDKGNDIKIFLGFVGQDSSNVPLVSSETMPATFLKFGVGGIVNDAVGFFTDITNKGKDFFT